MVENVRLITYSDEDADLSPIIDYFVSMNANVSEETRPRAPFAALEWLVPAVLVVYLAKAFFDGFLGELGSAAGKAAVDAITLQFKKLKLKNRRLYSARDLEQLSALKREGAHDEVIEKLGKPIAPLEFVMNDPEVGHLRLVIANDVSEDELPDVLLSLNRDLRWKKAETRLVLVYQGRNGRWQELNELIAEEARSKYDKGLPVLSLRNLGQKSALMLAEAGIRTVGELRALGAVRAYLRVKSLRPKSASLNLLWAIAAGLEDRDWRALSKAEKASLLDQVRASSR